MEELPFALQRNWRFKEDNGWDASHILKQCKNLTTVYLRLWIFQSWMYKQLIVCLVLRDTLQICKQLVGQNERFDSTQIVNLKVRLCDFYDALTCAKQTKRSSDCLHNNDCGLCDIPSCDYQFIAMIIFHRKSQKLKDCFWHITNDFLVKQRSE